MKVLKFGGTSVANAEAIKQTQRIVSESEGPVVVVVSALGGITDMLLQTAALAADHSDEYQRHFEAIEARHLETIRTLIPAARQAAVIGRVKTDLNTLETLLEGAFLIGETTPKLLDKIVSYGELLSSFIIASYYENEGMQAVFRDSRELIVTDNSFGHAQVRHAESDANIRKALDGTDRVTVLPGFIAANRAGDTTNYHSASPAPDSPCR